MQVSASPRLLDSSQVRRQTMVDCQIRTFDVTDQRVISRFLEVPRELFVPDDVRALAYSDIGFVVPPASSDGEQRYLLPPMILARMMQGAQLKSTDRVLDVAPGLGYSTAILAGLAGDVIALEAETSSRAALASRIDSFGDARARTSEGHLADGSASHAPFDVIFVNGAVQTNLAHLFDQLAEGGRLLAIERGANDPSGRAGKAMVFEKRGGGIGTRYLFDASAPCLRAFQFAPQFVF